MENWSKMIACGGQMSARKTLCVVLEWCKRMLFYRMKHNPCGHRHPLSTNPTRSRFTFDLWHQDSLCNLKGNWCFRNMKRDTGFLILMLRIDWSPLCLETVEGAAIYMKSQVRFSVDWLSINLMFLMTIVGFLVNLAFLHVKLNPLETVQFLIRSEHYPLPPSLSLSLFPVSSSLLW